MDDLVWIRGACCGWVWVYYFGLCMMGNLGFGISLTYGGKIFVSSASLPVGRLVVLGALVGVGRVAFRGTTA